MCACPWRQRPYGNAGAFLQLAYASISACPDLLAKDRYQRAHKMIYA
jgi:hypothetical protein